VLWRQVTSLPRSHMSHSLQTVLQLCSYVTNCKLYNTKLISGFTHHVHLATEGVMEHYFSQPHISFYIQGSSLARNRNGKQLSRAPNISPLFLLVPRGFLCAINSSEDRPPLHFTMVPPAFVFCCTMLLYCNERPGSTGSGLILRHHGKVTKPSSDPHG
jgi:hypothetical protein